MDICNDYIRERHRNDANNMVQMKIKNVIH